MTPEQKALWQRASLLFDQYLEDQPDSADSWLAALDVDNNIRAHVQQMINAHNATVSPLDASVSEWLPDAAGEQDADALKGRKVGDWVLLEAIGRGGMATVYKARRDTDQFEQMAAIKLLNVGLISSRLRENFDREQQILAGLQHPHIAGLLDAGVAEDGTPFIVMEHVDGQSIDQHVTQHRLNRRAVVDLSLQVCDAVAFAQRNLIVHRDLKPSNILVDARGSVQLLDFGIARLVEDADSDATTTRAFTPGYAAPEQLAGRPVTTATDVFGLGMVLYQLLTGHKPGRGENGAEPQIDLSDLKRRDADLANIVAMAVRPEADRRYASAALLAQDLRLWQEGRPTVATPDSTWYRLSKYLARHKVGVSAAAVAIVIAGVGIVSTLWQAQRAQAALSVANANAEQAEAVQNFLLEMFDGADPWSNQNEPVTADALLDTALNNLPDRLQAFPGQKASVLMTLSAILRNLGRDVEAARQAQVAVQLFTDNNQPEAAAKARLQQANVLGDARRIDEVQPLLEQVIVDTQRLGMVPENLKARMDLARLHTFTGQLAEQTALVDTLIEELPAITELPAHRKLVGAIYATFAENRENQGLYTEALDAARESEQWMTRALGPDHATVADTIAYQSTAYFSLGQWDEAEDTMLRAITIMEGRYPENHPSLMWARYQLGRTLLEGGRFDRALTFYKAFHQLCAQLLGPEDGRTIMARTNLGISYQRQGQLDEARRELEAAVPVMLQQAAGQPKAGVALARFGSVLSELGAFEAAEAKFADGIAILIETAGEDHPVYGQALTVYGEHQLRAGDTAVARDTLTRARDILLDAYSEDSEFVWITRLHLGLALAQLGESAAARQALEDSSARLQQPRYLRKYRRALAQAERVLGTLDAD